MASVAAAALDLGEVARAARSLVQRRDAADELVEGHVGFLLEPVQHLTPDRTVRQFFAAGAIAMEERWQEQVVDFAGGNTPSAPPRKRS